MAKFEVCVSTEIDGANVPVEAERFIVDTDDGSLVFFDGDGTKTANVRAVFAPGKWVYFARLDE